MSPESSFDRLLARLRDGDTSAQEAIFHRYADGLIALARRRLGPGLQRKEDPEDVLQSVFRSFFRRHGADEFRLTGWDGLWGLLAAITANKCGHRLDYFTAARRNVARETDPRPTPDGSSSSWEAIARDPTPAEAAILTETVESLLKGQKSDRDRTIVELALQGETALRISAAVGCSERTVERVLEQVRIRLEKARDATA